MRSPGKNHLRTCHLLVLLNGDEVGKCLERMNGCCLHGEDGTTAVLHKLVDDGFGIIVIAVFQSCKTANTNQVAETSHHRDGL